MTTTQTVFLLAALAAVAACQASSGDAGSEPASRQSPAASRAMPAPRALIEPTRLEAHGDVRVDDYYWMREREDPRVVEYLEAENAYAERVLAPMEPLQERLFEEFKGRIQETDETVHVPHGPFAYFTRTFEGKAYPVHCRRSKGGTTGTVTTLFDINELAKGHGFYRMAARVPSPDHARIAYAVDTVGRRIYDIQIKNVSRGDIERGIRGASGSMAWSSDGMTLFYARRDPVTLRAYQVWKHRIESSTLRDVLVYEETDPEFSCSVSRTRSGRYLKIVSSQTLTKETRVLRADDPDGEWRAVLAREPGHDYSVDHWYGDGEERFVIRTNRDAENFRAVWAPVGDPSEWTPLVPHRVDTLLESVDVFASHLVTRERRGGLTQLVIRPAEEGAFDAFELPFDDPTYRVGLTGNRDFVTRALRYSYSSLTTPDTTFEFDLDSGETQLLKQARIGGGFSPEEYVSRRIFADASDGASVPMSIVYRRDRTAAPGPLLLYGYGSYGSSVDAAFSPTVLSLLDRGFVYAIAHVRGGQALGRAWYESGKLMHKKNTFMDFIACAEQLVAEGLTTPDQLFASGGSAGGLLIGAVANMRPDLFHGLIAAVPFVDVVTTMLDETIPLTTFEYDEWGNPNDEEAYRYMLSYSPYDQVKEQDYPHLLVTTGFHDSQVQYWEPAKWVAKLRAKSTGDRLIVFDCEMQAGHGGVSGRYGRLRKNAQAYAFLLSRLEES